MISAILHQYGAGQRRRAIPAEYGSRTTLFNRSDRAIRRGLGQDLLAALQACAEPLHTAMEDTTVVRAHRSAGGAKRGSRARPSAARRPYDQDLCARRWRGRLYALMLSVGQAHDLMVGRAPLASVPPLRRCAEEAYDANHLREFLESQGTEAVIYSYGGGSSLKSGPDT